MEAVGARPVRRAASPAAARCPAALYGFAGVHCRGGAGAATAAYVSAASSCTPGARPRRGGRRGEAQSPLGSWIKISSRPSGAFTVNMRCPHGAVSGSVASAPRATISSYAA